MIELGKKQLLKVLKKVDFGVYLYDGENEEERVLLPKSQVPETLEVDDEIRVFIYRDSDDRLIATVNEPGIVCGEIALLKVKEITKVGAFLDWGLEKDLLLPFKEQTYEIKEGDNVLVRAYIDKSERLCATMKIYHYLRNDSSYKRGDRVQGFVYDLSDKFGVFIAVDNIYSARIPKKDCVVPVKYGDVVEARVTEVLSDGRLNLNFKEAVHIQIDKDAEIIYNELVKEGGSLPYNDKSDKDEIRLKFHMSKNSFKRAVGRLLKEGKITITDGGIELAKEK